MNLHLTCMDCVTGFNEQVPYEEVHCYNIKDRFYRGIYNVGHCTPPLTQVFGVQQECQSYLNENDNTILMLSWH